jgi:membrane fusion protein (multidrug efflux system)
MNAFRTFTVPALAAGLLVLASCGKQDQQSNGSTPPIPVRVEELKGQSFRDMLQATGIVRAIEDVMISPEEGGVVREWVVKKGRWVHKGEVIVRLKDDILKAGFDAANAQYQIAELNLEKQKTVFEQQGISEVQYRNLQYSRDAARANAELTKARWEHTRITSPIDGVLDDTMVDEGELAPPGAPIARVVNNSRMKIQADVPERYSNSIARGMNVQVTFDALGGTTMSGTVSFVGSAISASNRTLTVEVVVPNPGARLKPEMIAKLEIMREMKDNAILINQNIVQLVDRDRMIVYTDNGGAAQERVLKLGSRQGNLVEVLGGLKVGDRLITVGYQKLVDGQPITVTP